MTQDPRPPAPSPTPSPAPFAPAPPPAGPSGAPTSRPGPGPAAGAPAPSGRSRDVGFFAAMFDFRFQHFITVRFSSFLYALAWVVALLIWGGNILLGVAWGFAFAEEMRYDGEGPMFVPWPLVIGIVLGWIPSVITLLMLRLALEFSVATIRTAQNTEDLAARQS